MRQVIPATIRLVNRFESRGRKLASVEAFTEPGYIVECGDGSYGHAGGISGSCSSHGGNWRCPI
jgi:hypothetical protein